MTGRLRPYLTLVVMYALRHNIVPAWQAAKLSFMLKLYCNTAEPSRNAKESAYKPKTTDNVSVCSVRVHGSQTYAIVYTVHYTSWSLCCTVALNGVSVNRIHRVGRAIHTEEREAETARHYSDNHVRNFSSNGLLHSRVVHCAGGQVSEQRGD